VAPRRLFHGRCGLISFLGLYRGKSLEDAQLVAVSADSKLVSGVATALLRGDARIADPALSALRSGLRRALRLVAQEFVPEPEVAAQADRI